jgi:hypothetical protein
LESFRDPGTGDMPAGFRHFFPERPGKGGYQCERSGALPIHGFQELFSPVDGLSKTQHNRLKLFTGKAEKIPIGGSGWSV